MSTDPIAAGELGRRGAAATRLNYRKPCKVSARRNKGDHVAGMGAVSRQKTDMESRAGLRTQTAGRGREIRDIGQGEKESEGRELKMELRAGKLGAGVGRGVGGAERKMGGGDGQGEAGNAEGGSARQVAGIRPDGTRRASLPPPNPGTQFLTFNVVGQCLPRRGKGDAVAAPGGEELHRPGAAGAQHRAAHRVRPQQRQWVGGRVERRARGRASAAHRQQQRQQHQQPRRRRSGAAAAPPHPRPPRRGHRCAQVFGRLGAQRLRRGTSCLRREVEPADPARHGPAPPLAPPSGPARRPESRRRQKPGAGLPARLRAPLFAVRLDLRAARVLASAS